MDTRIYFARFCLRGQRRRDLEQLYFREYWFRDERVPRVRELADGVLVPIRELYTEAERKTSATYNEALPAGFNQDGLQVRLAAPGDTRVVWALGDPIERGGRRPDQIRMMEQLLPHVRHFVSVRTALAEARALGKSFADLLDATQVGVIHLNPRGRIGAANDRAVEVLRQRAGLLDDDGALHAVRPSASCGSPGSRTWCGWCCRCRRARRRRGEVVDSRGVDVGPVAGSYHTIRRRHRWWFFAFPGIGAGIRRWTRSGPGSWRRRCSSP